ncbi:CinA family protein [Legionella lytica]|uniref:CinA family protein n=1 Tax=Legionella lytica TaxID=96232 RepID=A0ABW8DBR8_9GAMM
MDDKQINDLINYIKNHELTLATAESCTAGEIISTLANHGNCGDCIYMGYLVYSSEAKQKHLGVKEETIKKYTLTSEEVAKEMARGVFQNEEVNLAIATTGITGDESMDGIKPGTVCFSWGFKILNHLTLFSETQLFEGTSSERCKKAVFYALSRVKSYHQQAQHDI